jgi:hypothetical protein
VRRRARPAPQTPIAPDPHLVETSSISVRETLAIARALAALAVKLAATVILVVLAFVPEYHFAMRIFWALGACGAALATAINSVTLYQRFANRNARPS